MMGDYADNDYALALGKEVAIADVDKELRLLWEEDKASTNASLINLAVYSERQGAIIKNSELVQIITREHACRALLIGVDRDSPEASIRAWITAHCHLSHGRKSVCCEQVAFQLTGRSTGRLRNTVFSHLNSDLPLVFWWQGELSSLFSERLYSLIDRFIFDSSEWSNPEHGYACLSEAMQSEQSLLPMDIEWTRSSQIRMAIAGLFDDPMAANALEHVSELHVVVHPDHRMAGLQLLAWVIQRTGWKRSSELSLDSDLGDVYYYETSAGSSVTAKIVSDPLSAPVGKMEFIAPSMEVRATREVGSPYIRQELHAGEHHIERRTPSNSDDSAELVMNQLSRAGNNSLYCAVMPEFLGLLNAE